MMDLTVRQRVVLLLALLYAFVGIAFAIPRTHVLAWRYAAWIVCGVAYAAHVMYEHFRLRQPALPAAIHMAAAAALGAFGLAVGANLNSLSQASSAHHRQLLLIALAAWPIIVGIPAFLVSYGLMTALSHVRWRPGRRV